MKFAFYKTSKPENVSVIEVRTISELLNLVDNTGEIIIGKYIMKNDPSEPDYFIEDYDDYRE